MKSFSQKISARPTRLTKDNLISLETLMVSDIIINDKSGIRFVSSSIGDTRIADWDVEHFLSHTELPDSLNEISIKILGRDSNEGNITVDAEFGLNNTTVSINGDSQNLVNGKMILIKNFLSQHRHKFWFLKTAPAYVFQGMFLFIALGVVGLIGLQFFTSIMIFNYTIAVTFVISVFLFTYSSHKIPFNLISLKTKEPFFSRSDFLTITFGFVGVFSLLWQVIDSLFFR